MWIGLFNIFQQVNCIALAKTQTSYMHTNSNISKHLKRGMPENTHSQQIRNSLQKITREYSIRYSQMKGAKLQKMRIGRRKRGKEVG